jgi:predicted SAM-dependent methyltransferase
MSWIKDDLDHPELGTVTLPSNAQPGAKGEYWLALRGPRFLNIGSGQRRFAPPWINADCVSRPPDQVPDVIMNALERWPWEDGSVDMVCFSQVYEHFHLTEGRVALTEAHRVLRPGGRVILTVPDIRALAQRWLTRQINDYIFGVNVYGAWQGLDGDDHHWMWTFESLSKELMDAAPWSSVGRFGWDDVPGASIAKDWWILGVQAIK